MLFNWNALAFTILAASRVEAGHNNAPTVDVTNGTITGVYSKEWDQDFFLGIPYAQPPIGDLRFRVPHSLNTTWNGSELATQYAPACIGYGSDQISYPEISEDCLYLNIVRPTTAVRNSSPWVGLPVVVFIHGGGLHQGSASDERYNLTYIVDRSVKINKPIIAVSINYRLSIWGFITGDEAILTGNANLGLRDQRLALRWIHENILEFRGDEQKITIWGQSAGAFSVGAHLTAYGGRDDKLFHGAIMQSGSPVYYGSMRDWNKTAFSIVSEGMSCNTTGDAEHVLQCLREVSFEDLNSFINETDLIRPGLWQPVVDGDFIQRHASEQLATGWFVKVPILVGANSDEGTALVDGNLINKTFDIGGGGSEWLIFLKENFIKVLETFPVPAPVPAGYVTRLWNIYQYQDIPDSFKGIWSSASDYYTLKANAYYGDAIIIAPRRLTCQTWEKYSVSSYCYSFEVVPNGRSKSDGATHFDEVAFVFNNQNGTGYQTNPLGGENAETFVAVSNNMTDTWIHFITKNSLDLDFYPEPASIAVFSEANIREFKGDYYPSAGIDLINSWNQEVYGR
ncbi:alpha/beta-hydrolase [Lophium mytilinum]|uniref:Carboxylic ester hydrolase n=1 Tax=Lophium mytilinum TaxID=390894 RepID=A0A6A6R0W2_9PEZI|nr:alpha/beta-hydrolase [Lophium mytilinum]